MSDTEKKETAEETAQSPSFENKKRIKCIERAPKYYEFNFDEKFKDVDTDTDEFLEQLKNVLKDEHNLKFGEELLHGDIVNTADYRYSFCYLVSKQKRKDENTDSAEEQVDTGDLLFLRNIDLSGAGYLTIPREISSSFESAINTYMNVEWAKDIALMIIEVDPADTFITSRLGNLPTGWSVEVEIASADIENIHLTSPEGDVTSYSTEEFDKLKLETLLEPQEHFKIKCIFAGDSLSKYCEKHDLDATKEYRIPLKTPECPEGWKIEGSGVGTVAGSFQFSWKLSGPKSTLEEVKKIVREFMVEGVELEFS